MNTLSFQKFTTRALSKYWLKVKSFFKTFGIKLKEQNKIFLGLIRDTMREFTNDQAQLMGAAMVYYTVLSLAPLLLFFLSIIGFILRFSPNGSLEQLYIMIEEQFGSQLRSAIDELLSTVKAQAITVSSIGFVALLLGGSSAFRFLSYSFRKIWRPDPRKASFRVAVRSLLRDHAVGVLFLLFIVGLLSITMMALNVLQIAQAIFVNVPTLQTLKAIQLQPIASIFFGTIVLMFVYRYLPPSRLNWRDVWLGAILAAVLWEGASILLRLYFDIRTSLIYGIVGSILVITIWVYTLCQILFLGAEFCKVHSRWYLSLSYEKEK